MKMISATMAHNIATEFEGNPFWKKFFSETMGKIYERAVNGHTDLDIYIPIGKRSLEFLENSKTFFEGLGYKISTGGTCNGVLYYTIYW